jgi:hypothetical protein
MGSCCSADQDSLCSAVLETVVGICEMPNGRRQVLGSPSVSARLRVADSDQLDERLLIG